MVNPPLDTDPGKDLDEALQVAAKDCGEASDIAQTHQACVPLKTIQDPLHQAFGGGRGIAQSEGHDTELVESTRGQKAEIYQAKSVSPTCQYPLARSRAGNFDCAQAVQAIFYLEKRVAVFVGGQYLRVPSFFLTRTMGMPKGSRRVLICLWLASCHPLPVPVPLMGRVVFTMMLC